MGTIDVRLFGAPEILRDGQPIAVDTRKAIALLAILVVEQRPMRRDTLSGLLWPESTQERARASLRRTLSSLRSAIGADGVTASRESVELALAPPAVDVLMFEALSVDSPAEALEVYRGPFLEGFSLADAADFDDWHRGERDRFQLRADGLLDELSSSSTPALAAEFARRRLDLDPLNEAACRQAMSALRAVGDRSGAIAVYRELVRHLDDQLGVEPLAETIAVYDSVRRGQAPSTTAKEPRPGPDPVSADGPLIGRTAELEALTEAVAEPSLVLVTGEAGVGRTRVIEDWAAGRHDVLVLRGHVGERNVPYAPFSEWLAEGPSDTSPIRLFESLASSLGLNSGAVLVIDDLQFIDSGTTAFLTYLLHRRERFGWSVVGTWRGERVRPDDSWWDLLTEGRREGWASELHVGRLEADDMAELIRARGPVRPEELRAIVEFSDGVPLLAVELMRLGPGAEALPPVIRDLMKTRLVTVSPVARQVVEALAVIDRPADEHLLRAVAGRSATEVSEALEELEAAEIVKGTSSVGLSHHLLGAVALADVPSARERLLHARAGAALGAAEAAAHMARAGDQALAAELHIRAASEAEQAQDLDSALHHLRSAVALGRADDPVIHRRIGDIETIQGGYERARRAYEISAARSVGTELSLVELQLARLALRCNDTGLARSHLDSAEAELLGSDAESDRVARVAADVAIARVLTAADDEQSVDGDGDDAIALAERLSDTAIEAVAHSAAGLLAYRRHRIDEAEEHARQAMHLAQLDSSPSADAAAANLLGLIRVADGRYEDAIPFFETAVSVLSRHGEVHRLAAAHDNLATALHRAGRDAEARDHQLESARLFSEVSGPPSAGRADIWFLGAW